jgi:hypothetical protein
LRAACEGLARPSRPYTRDLSDRLRCTLRDHTCTRTHVTHRLVFGEIRRKSRDASIELALPPAGGILVDHENHVAFLE